tara:strand:+ start:49 stop:264 length:216 start_codon:yes stop_codon:yes gene_type:complete
MVAKKEIRDFKNLDNYPDLRDAVVPPITTLPFGSINTKVIIQKGKIVERVYETPKGELISLLSNAISIEAA